MGKDERIKELEGDLKRANRLLVWTSLTALALNLLVLFITTNLIFNR